MGISHIQVKHKQHRRLLNRDDSLAQRDEELEARATSCNLYQAPAMGARVNSLVPLPISWDTSCLDAPKLDIYLIAPTADIARIHLYTNVPNTPSSSGSTLATYNAELMPRWWNATSEQQLTISIVPMDKPPYTSNFAAGPIFTATYEAPADGTTPAVADTSVFSNGITDATADMNANKSSITPGGKAAAALFPILFVIGLGVYGYIRWKRTKEANKRKEWTEKVDKRMSTISTDWKSVSAAGANAAVRHSIAVSRASMALARQSGVNAFNVDESAIGSTAPDSRERSQMRTGVGLRNPAGLTSSERVSRVSFAPDNRPSSGRISFADTVNSRPSGESRRGGSRAFHTSIYNADDNMVPPVPALPAVASLKEKNEKDQDDGSFSPRQREGALALTPEDIRARINAGKKDTQEKENFAADLMPALSMMRTGDATNDDYLLPASPPPAAYPKITTTALPPTPQNISSPVMSTIPMQPMPANVMSPDDMLRAYAERKKQQQAAAAAAGRVASPVMTNSPSSNKHASLGLGLGRKKSIVGTPISYPIPASGGATPISNVTSNTGMRVLYDQQETATYNVKTGTITTSTTGTTSDNEVAYGGYGANAQSAAYTASEYSAVENYAQDNAYAFGHHPNGSIGVGSYGGAQYAIGDDEDDASHNNMAGRGAGMGRAA